MSLSRRKLMKLGVFSTLAVGGTAYTQKENSKPNIIFILADDLGYGDLQCLNPESKIKTPHTSKMAAEGMIFSDAHSGSAVCTPTRYGVVTGRYCWRSRMKRGVLQGYSSHLIEPDRLTVADVMKKSGYQTACIGKWHLGMDMPKKPKNSKLKTDYSGVIKNGPNANGFDYFYGVTASLDFPPYVYVENDKFTAEGSATYPGSKFPNYLRKGEMAPGFKHIECLDHITEKSQKYISEQAKAKQHFFLYFPITAPHKPALPAKRYQGKSKLGPYGDFIMQVDDVIGTIMETVKNNKIDDNTLIILSSDNGSYMYAYDEEKGHVEDETVQGFQKKNHRANYIYRGTKADVWESGHRVPFIARWPSGIKGGSKSETAICLTDLLATCAEITNFNIPEKAAEDSFSFLPDLKGKKRSTKRPPVIHHSANGTFALRDEKWKLIFGNGSGGRGLPKSKPFSKPYQLYDMKADPSETKNLAEQHPEVVQRLTEELEKVRKNA